MMIRLEMNMGLIRQEYQVKGKNGLSCRISELNLVGILDFPVGSGP